MTNSSTPDPGKSKSQLRDYFAAPKTVSVHMYPDYSTVRQYFYYQGPSFQHITSEVRFKEPKEALSFVYEMYKAGLIEKPYLFDTAIYADAMPADEIPYPQQIAA